MPTHHLTVIYSIYIINQIHQPIIYSSQKHSSARQPASENSLKVANVSEKVLGSSPGLADGSTPAPEYQTEEARSATLGRKDDARGSETRTYRSLKGEARGTGQVCTVPSVLRGEAE